MGNRSQKSRSRLETATALALVVVFALLGVWSVIHWAQPGALPETDWLPIPDDKPLLTDYHKALARQDGIAVYQLDGTWYVDPNVPAEY